MNHTPGPWKVLPPDQVRGEHGQWICSCDGGQHRAEEDRANARLIAAAPEMLEALRAIVATLTQPVQFSPQANAEILRGDAAAAVRFAQAAIARAEGGGR